MNRQEVFNKVRDHLLAQGEKSITGGPNARDCRYRGPNGLSCAVGCLIEDAAYSTKLEGLLVWDSRMGFALQKSGIPVDGQSLELLDDLQTVHDAYSPAHWAERLTELAHRQGLQP